MPALFAIPSVGSSRMILALTAVVGLSVLVATESKANADIIEFKVTGAAGDGLLEGNQ